MGTDQHNLICEVATRNLTDDVKGTSAGRFVLELGLDVEFHLYRQVVVEQTNHTVVVLYGKSDLWRSRAVAAAAHRLHEDRAAIEMLLLPTQIAAAGGHVRVAPSVEQRDDTF